MEVNEVKNAPNAKENYVKSTMEIYEMEGVIMDRTSGFLGGEDLPWGEDTDLNNGSSVDRENSH